MSRLQAYYESPALIFSEKGQCQIQWLPFLEGWNVEQSVIGNMWLKQGEERGESKGALKQARASLTSVLRVRFPNEMSPSFAARIQAQENLEILNHWHELAITAANYYNFIAAVEAGGNPK